VALKAFVTWEAFSQIGHESQWMWKFYHNTCSRYWNVKVSFLDCS